MKIIKRIGYTLIILVLLLFVIGYLVFLSKNLETKTIDATARKQAGGKFISLQEGTTHYELGGPDTGKTVVLVHGFSVPYYIWNGTYDSLVNHGFHVLRYDEYGRGFSDRPDKDYDPAFYRLQLFEVITALKLKTPVDLVGVSFGGAVVTDFTVHHPAMVDKIVLVDPVVPFGDFPVAGWIANYKMAINPDKQLAGQLEDFKYPGKFPDWTLKYSVQMEYKGFRRALIATRHNYPASTIRNNYVSMDSLQKKVFLIWGKEDHTVPFTYSDTLRKVLHSTFFPVADAAHLPHLEKPAQVNPAILSFLLEKSEPIQ